MVSGTLPLLSRLLWRSLICHAHTMLTKIDLIQRYGVIMAESFHSVAGN